MKNLVLDLLGLKCLLNIFTEKLNRYVDIDMNLEFRE